MNWEINMKIKIILLLCLCVLTGCSKPNINKLTDTSNKTSNTIINATFTGDLLFETPLYNWWNNYDTSEYFEQVKPYLTGDLVVGNQEVLLGGDKLGISGSGYSFNGPEKLALEVKKAGFNFLTLANNHEYDRGFQGIKNTVECLNKNNMDYTGMYATKQERNNIKIVEKNGVKISFLAYTYGTNQQIEEEYNYAIPYFLEPDLTFSENKKAMLKKDVEKAKSMSDVVIVAMHWGKEFTYELSQSQKQAAKYLNELEVDLIIGNHSHNLQPIEYLYNQQGYETFVVYSLGNFVSADVKVSRASERFKNMYQIGGILNLNINYNKDNKTVHVENVKLTPVVNHYENNYQSFKLIPLKDYNEELCQRHDRSKYCNTFTIENINQEIKQLYKEFIYLDK